jgi:cAMP phosphodiesterase
LSSNPIEKKTIYVLDRFFDALHNKNFNDLQIIDFYLELTPEERVSIGCKP